MPWLRNVNIAQDDEDAEADLRTPGTHRNPRTSLQAKRLDTIRAELALRGIELHELRTGGFLIVHRGTTRHLATVQQLQAAAHRMGIT